MQNREFDQEVQAGLGEKYVNYTVEAYSRKFIEGPVIDNLLQTILSPRKSILEVGVGNGKMIEFLIDNGALQTRITGIDINNELLSAAAKRFPLSLFYERDILQNFNLRKKFDVATCSFVLHYFSPGQTEEILKNVNDTSFQDGRLMYVVPHPVRWVRDNLNEYFGRRVKIVDTPWGTDLPYFQKTMGDYLNATIRAGFEIERVEEPEVSAQGRELPEFERYNNGPTRLIILAKKK